MAFGGGNLTRVSAARRLQLNRRRCGGLESVNEHKWAGVDSSLSGTSDRQSCFLLLFLFFFCTLILNNTYRRAVHIRLLAIDRIHGYGNVIDQRKEWKKVERVNHGIEWWKGRRDKGSFYSSCVRVRVNHLNYSDNVVDHYDSYCTGQQHKGL